MISVGASHNTCHLFTGKITTEGEGGSFLESSIREEPNHTPAMSYFRFKAMHPRKKMFLR